MTEFAPPPVPFSPLPSAFNPPPSLSNSPSPPLPSPFLPFPLPLKRGRGRWKMPDLNTINVADHFLTLWSPYGSFVLKEFVLLSLKLTWFRLVLLRSEIIVPRNEWIHVAMSWKRGSSGKLKLYANGEKKFETAVDGNVNLDFRNSGRSVYNIGLRIDTGDTIQAYLSDLVIFNRELPEHELMEAWVQSHALYNTLFSWLNVRSTRKMGILSILSRCSVCPFDLQQHFIAQMAHTHPALHADPQRP